MGPRNPTFGTFEGFLKERSGPIASRLGGGREEGMDGESLSTVFW